MFEGEKTFVFWLGLIILALASIVLFSECWYTTITLQPDVNIDYRFLVPPVIGTVVFILIGLYMMMSGTKKKEEGKIQSLNTRPS